MISRPAQITDRHLARWAVAYIRQSSPEQKEKNVGSTAIQRDLALKLEAWGWPPTMIRVVDVDLGISGSRPGAREGFAQLLEQMKADEIGVVAVVDSSRLSRNVIDLFQFVHVAQQHGVLLVQGDQVIDFNDPNSFFIGGILGLNAIRENGARAQLSVQARRKKAAQGIAPTTPPVGYVRRKDGAWLKDTDPAVRDAINLIFDKFLEIGSIRGVVRYLRNHRVQVPRRKWKDRSRWQDATYSNIAGFLKNRVYAGDYIFGQTVQEPPPEGSRKRGRQRPQPESEWIPIKYHHEPYLDPGRWPEIGQQVAGNRWPVRPPAGRGEAVVQGLLRCTLHQRTFQTVYSDRYRHADGAIERRARYFCGPPSKETVKWRSHLSVMAVRMDAVIERVLLQRLTPLALDGIQEGVRQELREHDTLTRKRQDDIRRLEQAVADAERAYLQANPADLLFRARLSELSEKAIRELKSVQTYNLLHPLVPPLTLDEKTLSELRGLLSDLPRLWRDARVTFPQRKAIARMVIKTIHVTPAPDAWPLEIEWESGARTPLELTRRDRAPARPMARSRRWPIDRSTYQFIRDQAGAGTSRPAIAQLLNAMGAHHPLGSWTAASVGAAIRRLKRGEIPGVPPLPLEVPLADHVRRLYAERRSPAEMVAQLRLQGVKTKYGTLVTREVVYKALERLGLRPHAVLMDEHVCALLREWGPGSTAAEAAARLNQLGLTTEQGRPWAPENAREKLRDQNIPFVRLWRPRDKPQLEPGGLPANSAVEGDLPSEGA